MSEDWVARSFDMAGSPIPVSQNLSADRATVVRLVALAEQDTYSDPATLDAAGLNITPWVAWQIGIYAEHVAIDTPHAVQAAVIALWSAAKCKDPARVLANTLTAANIFFKLGDSDMAQFLYEEILSSPLSPNTSERVAANLGIANINLAAGNSEDAAYYFDKCLTSAHLILEKEGRNGMLANAAQSYLRCKDLGGALACLTQLDTTLARKLENDLRRRPPSLEQRLMIVSRLHVLGQAGKAEELMLAWNPTHQRRRK